MCLNVLGVNGRLQAEIGSGMAAIGRKTTWLEECARPLKMINILENDSGTVLYVRHLNRMSSNIHSRSCEQPLRHRS